MQCCCCRWPCPGRHQPVPAALDTQQAPPLPCQPVLGSVLPAPFVKVRHLLLEVRHELVEARHQLTQGLHLKPVEHGGRVCLHADCRTVEDRDNRRQQADVPRQQEAPARGRQRGTWVTSAARHTRHLLCRLGLLALGSLRGKGNWCMRLRHTQQSVVHINPCCSTPA
jgi:hypothetical protein